MERVALNKLPVVEKNTDNTDRQQREIREKKLKKICADFESIFIINMFKAMRRTIPQSGSKKLPGKDIYTMMFDRKVAEDFAKRDGGVGLQKAIFNQLNKQLYQGSGKKP